MTYRQGLIGIALISLTLSGIAFAQSPRVSRPVEPDTSPALQDSRWDLSPLMQRAVDDRHLSQKHLRDLREKLIRDGYLNPPGMLNTAPRRHKDLPTQQIGAGDPMVQARSPATVSGFGQPLISFDGVGYSTFDETGVSPARVYPDVNIAVGMRYVVETVNAAYAVYDKANGSLILGPTGLRNLWADFNGRCGELNARMSHPVVLYDQFAQRWVVSVTTEDPASWCVAVSKTGDPTGEFYRYEFDDVIPAGQITDGIKLGLWPNAWYASLNRYDAFSGQFSGVSFVALNRAAMLDGKAARAVSIDRSKGVYSELPASLDGFTPPPAGAPGLFMNYVSPNLFGAKAPYALLLWRMNVDWDNPGASSLTGPKAVEVPPFNDVLCTGAAACIPEPSPGDPLDAISDRLMYRLAYRNFGDHEALVVNHTVTTNADGAPPAAIRWYELDTSTSGGGDWSLAQSGTYAPSDGASRWVGSIAMDHAGNMALGYNLSSTQMSPSVAYTGRLASDPAGELTQAETILVQGSGAQTNRFGFWGKYSSMVLDPVNDCTFWYAQEFYSGVVSSGAWSTHIAAFNFDQCTPVAKGTLSGVVTNAQSGLPVQGAVVALSPGEVVVASDEKGHYSMQLPPGAYRVQASAFGYQTPEANIKIAGGNAITHDFALVASPKAVLSGKVVDGSGHGYGLYAGIKISAPDFGQVAEVWTDPATGQYSVNLPQGFEYTLETQAMLAGYKPAAVQVTLADDLTQNIALKVEAACAAPGYAFQLGGFGEDFNGAWPPAGWSVENDVSGSPVMWQTNTYWNDRNVSGGTGMSATVDSSEAYPYNGPFDASLVSPSIAVSNLPADPVVQYKANYQNSWSDALDLGISVDGGTWTTLLHWKKSHGNYNRLPGVKQKVDLGPFIGKRASSIRLRWRHYDLSGGPDIYVQIDDVVIGGCQPVPGGLIAGKVSDANTGVGIGSAIIADEQGNLTHPALPIPGSSGPAQGTYELFASPGQHNLSVTASGYSGSKADVGAVADGIVEKNFPLTAGKLTIAPSALSVHVPVGSVVQQQLTLTNDGTARAQYTVLAIDAPAPLSHPNPSGPFADTRRYGQDEKFVALTNCARAEPCDAPSYLASARSPVPAAAALTRGDVVTTLNPELSVYGLGVDRKMGDLWIGSSVGIGGDGRDHRFLFDGTNTGDVINITPMNNRFAADMAYDDITGMLWQVSVEMPYGQASFIYELDPKTQTLTGKRTKVPSPLSVRGLAFDPVSNTWYAGDFSTNTVYHFDEAGTLLDSVTVGLPIQGMTYNPTTGHLFVLTSYGTHPIFVLDAQDSYKQIGYIDIKGLTRNAPGAGLSHDCDGHLWVSDMANNMALEVVSGEQGWCSFEGISWLKLAPKQGTIAAAAATTLDLSFDGKGKPAFTVTQAYLKLVGDTPYPAQNIPLIVHWDARPVSLVLTGEASPQSVREGSNLVYNLTVQNEDKAGHGVATEAKLSYRLPSGVSFVSASGTEGVTCTSPTANSSEAPATTTNTGANVICYLGKLEQGVSKFVTIAVQPDQAGMLTSHFEVSARESNDSGEGILDVEATVIGTADVSASAPGAMTIPANGSGALKFAVSNSGPDTATNIRLKVKVDGSVELTGATSGRGSCKLSKSRALLCDLGGIKADGKVEVTLSASALGAGTATLQAQVLTSADDPDQSNNVTTTLITVKAISKAGSDEGDGGGGALGWLVLVALFAMMPIGALVRLRQLLRS